MGILLVANPGSSSRKYALYDQQGQSLTLLSTLNVETSDKGLIGTLHKQGEPSQQIELNFDDVAKSGENLLQICEEHNLLSEGQSVETIAMRIVAPGVYFMYDHVVDEEFLQKLEEALELAPIHIKNVFQELKLLKNSYPSTTITGISDSSFHKTKPSYAWNYGINLQHADNYDIKRFGFHGLSIQASIDSLWEMGKLPPKVIVCHLGSGSSVTAVFHGRSVDTTMGYSPLEGVLMATRSGSIDPVAVKVLAKKLNQTPEQTEEYLNRQGGLMGLSGSSDIRELIERESNGDHIAHLALTTLVHTYHKAIGQMIVVLGGVDLIVFTGTVGERSAILRKRIVAHLHFVDFFLDGVANDACLNPSDTTFISNKGNSKPIVVIPTNESLQIAKKSLELVS